MLRWPVKLLIFIAAVMFAGNAYSDPTISIKYKYYEVQGTTGQQLLKSIGRNGPRRGIFSRAIAQTSYDSKPHIDLKYIDGVCSAYNPEMVLNMTYTYPKPAQKLPASVQQYWDRFIQNVIAHEKRHGAIAIKMAYATDDLLQNFKMRDKPRCWRAKRELRRRVGDIWKKYDHLQDTFDAKEHARGGKVDRMVDALVEPLR